MRSFVVVVLMLMMVVLPGVAATARTESADYFTPLPLFVLSGFDLGENDCRLEDSNWDWGEACFRVLDGEATLQVSITDAVSPLVSGSVIFDHRTTPFDERVYLNFCGSGTFPIPTDALTAWVYPGQYLNGEVVECDDGPRTMGTVFATFT